MMIIYDKQSEYAIVIPAIPAPVEETAATELQQYLKKSYNVELPIKKESEAATKAFYIGRTEYAKKAGVAGKSVENWIIKEDCVKPNGYNQTDKTNSPMFDPVIAKKMSDTKREKYGKRVCEIDSANNILAIWNSIAEAGEATGLDRFKISNVCNGTRLTTGNRIFRFLDEENEIIIPEIKVNQVQNNRITKSSKQVIKMNDNNEELQIYGSVALAAADNDCDASGISKVCNGKRNKCGGFKWKYQTT